LRYKPVVFSDEQIASIGRGFAHSVDRSAFVIHECSILPTHVHAVVARHTYKIEKVMNQLKGEATKSLARDLLHPFQNTFLRSGKRHTPWADDGWDVYLDCGDDIRRASAYVRGNPIKEGRPQQVWPFVRPYV
jgi:REP element-mobilizing transposase RayT